LVYVRIALNTSTNSDGDHNWDVLSPVPTSFFEGSIPYFGSSSEFLLQISSSKSVVGKTNNKIWRWSCNLAAQTNMMLSEKLPVGA